MRNHIIRNVLVIVIILLFVGTLMHRRSSATSAAHYTKRNKGVSGVNLKVLDVTMGFV